MGLEQYAVNSYPPSLHWEASQDTHPKWVVTETSDEGEVTRTEFESKQEAQAHLAEVYPQVPEGANEEPNPVDPDDEEETSEEVADASAEKAPPKKRAAAKK